MISIGIRELKQNPSAIVARVERGESLTITVQGRPAAQIVPLAGPRSRWISSAELDEALGAERSDDTGWLAEWNASRDGDPITDPWADAE
jgi:prevent-host-death family protein